MIYDQYGQPILTADREALINANEQILSLRRKINLEIRARYDAAQTTVGNENHWSQADSLDPHAANSLPIRRKLRTRSRYEVIENNPYLKGIILTLANDFTGSGPKLQIIQKSIEDTTRQVIEAKFWFWWQACSMSRKLWRIYLAKIVDGEGFMFAYNNVNRTMEYKSCPVTLDFFPVETDRVSNLGTDKIPVNQGDYYELDGLRWDRYENPLAYNLLPYHPGSMMIGGPGPDMNWVHCDEVLHWFRQDRGWLRGVPELTPSLPLCALLRRYTLAVVRAAELGANFSAVLQTEGPGIPSQYGLADDPFDTIPLEQGMMLRLPWGYKMAQLRAEQPIQVYDMFVGSLLREICRPLNTPFNVASGSSAESNMASAIVDSNIYRGARQQERSDCNESMLNKMFCLWYAEASLLPNYIPKIANGDSDRLFPERSWRYDKIGLDHTDPAKVQQALQIAKDQGFITDRDIQETYYNRDVEDWREELRTDLDFRKEVGLFQPEPDPIELAKASKPPGMPGKKPVPAKKAKK